MTVVWVGMVMMKKVVVTCGDRVQAVMLVMVNCTRVGEEFMQEWCVVVKALGVVVVSCGGGGNNGEAGSELRCG